MENDIENNDDNDFIDDFDDNYRTPIPNHCLNETDGIESLRICFMQRYNACPALFIGSLQDACYTALNSSTIKDRRPLLVYIHNDNNRLSNIFCQNIICSEKIIDYLMDNYIIWSWDITHKSNRDILINIWNEIFSNEVSIDFSNEECPMLIGIMRQPAYEKNSSLISQYKLSLLIKSGTSTSTKKIFDPITVLNDLSMFKQEYDNYEKILSSKLFTKTGLHLDDALEICKYLSLNNAIKIFFVDILYFLHKSNSKIHITEPCNEYFDSITQHINSEQVVSICLNNDENWCTRVFNFLPLSNKVISLILINFEIFAQINEYEIYFPNLTCISLSYNNEIGLNIFKNIFLYLPRTIKRFEIHCKGLLCTHYDIVDLNLLHTSNYGIKYFLLDMDQCSLVSNNECFQHYNSCFLKQIIDLVRWIFHIQCIHLIINKYDIEKLLHINNWKTLINYCSLLKKIIWQINGSMLDDEQVKNKILEFQNELCYRDKFNFRLYSSN